MAERKVEKLMEAGPVCCGMRMLYLGDQHTFEGSAAAKRDDPNEPLTTLEYGCGECGKRATVHHKKEASND